MAHRGQIAVEYMIILGLLLLFVTPLIYYALASYASSNDIYRAQVLVARMSDTVDIVYTQNQPSQQVLTLLFPENIVDTILVNKTVGVIMVSGDGNTTVSLPTKGCVSGFITPTGGYRRILFKATDNCVNVTEY
jgi:uncharacterized protein (UPF0333 family)